MKKSIKQLLCLTLASSMVLSIVGCKDPEETGSGLDAEKRPVLFSIGALDENFNPFFATSATDTEVIAQTQVGMMSSDKDGNPVCGYDQPTVVLDYQTTMYDASGAVSTTGDVNGHTTYEFLIKNGVKFSDGTPLTIKDVLFSLYVYLDPAYTGSATIYSTDIKGLNAYRAQNPQLGDDEDVNINNTYYTLAQTRIRNIIDYVEDDGVLTDQITADIAKVKELFKKEVTTDWNTNAGSLEGYQEEYSFTEDWQSYYFVEGIVTVQTELNEFGATVRKKDPVTGKYLTSLDNPDNVYAQEMQAAIDANLEAYKTQYGCDDALAREYIIRDTAIDTVYNSYCYTNDKLPEILSYWATASNALDEFAAEERSKYYAGLTEKVESISGITNHKTTSFNGKMYGNQTYAAEHDVLRIDINGIDPKAIWNFSFTVSPLHYYSSTNYGGVDYVNGFNGHIKTDTVGIDDGINFGVKVGDSDFVNKVLKEGNKSGLPKGAGVYMATNYECDQSTVNSTNFCRNNIVYYERNPYFYTLGIDNANMTLDQIASAQNDTSRTIHNALIKRFNYKVVNEDKIKGALVAQEIDFGQPSANPDNVAEIAKPENSAYLGSVMYDAGGYGYVGINPKYVPDVAVRRAIMKAMNTSAIVQNYYGTSLASVIYRPVSKTSWAYNDAWTEYEGIAYTTQEDDIRNLVESAGWRVGSDGIYEKKGEKLKIKFTIAGETQDHPAFDMFMDAASFLNGCGFDITVGTDVQALKKLATGGLAVWAAAWSSGIDPDPYQLYHKDSTATSVNNWNYKEILNSGAGEWTYEKNIINQLSAKIDAGRETLNQEGEGGRIAIYEEAYSLIMDLAVELPTYQRKEFVVYNKNVIDATTLNHNASHTASVVNQLWKLNYVK